MMSSPISHGSNGPEGDDEGPIRIGPPVLPPPQRRHEVALRAVGLGDDGRQPAVCEQRIRRPAHTHRVAGSGIGERSPLGALVY
jgi:hypothetical protein